MKLLRNPWVTGALALAAVGLVCFQIFEGRPRSPGEDTRPRVSQSVSPTIAEKRPLAPVELLPARSVEFVPPGREAIDRNYVQAHLSEWLEAPRRDPFRLEGAVPVNTAGQSPSPVLQWKLKAIWRQTGGRVAAINNRVYAEGDTIQGYKISRIEGDQVWLEGPHGKERLGFEKNETGAAAHPKATTPTNQPAQLRVPASPGSRS